LQLKVKKADWEVGKQVTQEKSGKKPGEKKSGGKSQGMKRGEAKRCPFVVHTSILLPPFCCHRTQSIRN
jgi:hypothetical protein